MCEGKGKCQSPSECSPEQIRQCHGDSGFHPCGQEKPATTKRDSKQTKSKK